MNLAAIVDLRRCNERRREPSKRWAGFSVPVIENSIDGFSSCADDPYVRLLLEYDGSTTALHTFMIHFYRSTPFERRYVDLFSRYIRAVATTQRPVLMHCGAGKDRTGILAALTLELLGAHRDDAMRDYLLTNEHAFQAAELEANAQWIHQLCGRWPTAAFTQFVMAVSPDYLTEFYRVIDDAGGAERYTETVLSVPPETIALLRRQLVEACVDDEAIA